MQLHFMLGFPQLPYFDFSKNLRKYVESVCFKITNLQKKLLFYLFFFFGGMLFI